MGLFDKKKPVEVPSKPKKKVGKKKTIVELEPEEDLEVIDDEIEEEFDLEEENNQQERPRKGDFMTKLHDLIEKSIEDTSLDNMIDVMNKYKDLLLVESIKQQLIGDSDDE